MTHIDYLLETIKESAGARANGNTPFGAILVGPDGSILLRQQNIELTQRDCTGHAEASLMRAASKKYSKEFLWTCTLYSSVEPCAMCTGAIYWGNVGRIVYGLAEEELFKLTGDDGRNLSFQLPCRDVLKHGRKNIEVLGPFNEVEEAVKAVHEGFWK